MSSFDNDDDGEDEDLQQAIALSLQNSQSTQSHVPATKNVVVDLTSDAEDDVDEDLRQAIALSLQGVTRESPLNDRIAGTSRPTKPAAAASGASGESAITSPMNSQTGLLGLDRKAMEQERLARLGKRKRDPSPERRTIPTLRTKPADTQPSSNAPGRSSTNRVLEYPRGAIKRTFATKYPRTDDISIDEVLAASSVHIAVISSFMWDSDWLYEKLDPTKIKQVWIMNAKDQDTQQRWIREMKESGVPNLKVHFPPMDGMVNNMHSKFMLLFGKDKLRFVVPTANMKQVDWGEVANNWQPAVMENSVFLIDLPRRADGIISDPKDLTSFGKELVHFLKAQKVGQSIIDGVLKFDFSQTSHLAFVHSIGGARSESSYPTGLPGLSKAIRDLKLDNVENIELDHAASSLGAVNDNLLQRIYLAARGEAFTAHTETTNVRDKMRIYFPTNEAVEKSVGGPDCGGIITLTRQHYSAPTFPRDCLRNYDSYRRGVLSHNKLLFARGRKQDGTAFAWVYIGSANISESAWGGQKVVKNGKLGSLNIKNWECGIVMPVPEDKMVDLKLDDAGIPPMSVFEGTVEIPFVFPGEEYNGRQPWFFKAGDERRETSGSRRRL